MGVKGFTQILIEHGWAHKSRRQQQQQQASKQQKKRKKQQNYTTDACSLWAPYDYEEDDDMLVLNEISQGVERIAPGSVLHLDGNGWTFYVYRVAYHRHVCSILNVSMKTTTFVVPQDLSKRQRRLLTPSLLPLQLLSRVAKEFLQALNDQYTLIVYWDGALRRTLKQGTNQRRDALNADEWNTLYECITLGGKSTAPDFPWCDHLPPPRLMVQQLQHTIATMTNAQEKSTSSNTHMIEQVHCIEEADPVMAKEAANNNDHYIIGYDSDFCFFANIAYIPLDSMAVVPMDDDNCEDETTTSLILAARVLRRNVLASSLGLSDDNAMVELAILLGNDYVQGRNWENNGNIIENNDDDTLDKSSTTNKQKDWQIALEFMRDQSASYRVSASTSDVADALRFVRSLYNHEDVSSFPLMEKESNVDANDDTTMRPQLPRDLVAKAVALLPGDSNIRDAVVRVLKDYVAGSSEFLVSPNHIQILIEMPLSNKGLKGVDHTKGAWGVAWEDVVAAYLIENVIYVSLFANAEAKRANQYAPNQLFDQQLFHFMMKRYREEEAKNGSGLETEAAPPPEQGSNENQNSISDHGRSETEDPPTKCTTLPIDEHRDEIIDSIQRNRITIIQGETGCGKSTRIPCMLLRAPAPHPMVPDVRLFMSQPRRLAAKALVERIRQTEPDLRDKVALRMGHGVKEYESRETSALFTTTGYLVRYMAHSFSAFDNVTHMIIDEVHERSVDTDILCLMCRRLLQYNSTIRLVLMSATLAADLYREYFQVGDPPLRVGARRFPVDEVYLEELPRLMGNTPVAKKLVQQCIDDCNRLRARTAPNAHYMERICKIVVRLALVIGRPGSSILVFVPGMHDILLLSEGFDAVEATAGTKINCYPIHSDVPFEDQMKIFQKVGPSEIRLFLATNSAESSITLPDVDNVVCLGLCKQIVYNEASHRQMLQPAWISKASATQRAGRTGRVRPGVVYRLYTKAVYNSLLSFEPGEMVRIPLDSVILMLKDNMIGDDPVTETLLDCLEPPDVSNITRSFQSLFDSNFITEPDDDCNITLLGSFVSKLGIDLKLGGLLGLGLQFGVGAEAVALVACLSFPQSPWKIPNAMIQSTDEYNSISLQSFTSRCRFDANLFSDPLAMISLLWEYESKGKKSTWCRKNGVQESRARRLLTTYDNLRRKVADFCHLPEKDLELACRPEELEGAKLRTLRIIQVWSFHDTMIQCTPSKFTGGISEESFSILMEDGSNQVTKDQLLQVLDNDRHPFELRIYHEVHQKGTFKLINLDFNQCVSQFEQRLVSYAYENSFFVAWALIDSLVFFMIRSTSLEATPSGTELRDLAFETLDHHSVLTMTESKQKRGIGERDCGLWKYNKSDLASPSNSIRDNQVYFLFGSPGKAKRRVLLHSCDSHFRHGGPSSKGIGCTLTESKSKHRFHFRLSGNVGSLSALDIQDMLSTPKLGKMTTETKEAEQSIVFSISKPEAVDDQVHCESELFSSIPEGARMISSVASGRRRDHSIRCLKKLKKTGKTKDAESNEEETGEEEEEGELVLYPSKQQTQLSKRWKRFNTNKDVYVPDDSSVATALPVRGPDVLYCCCANTLEVRGGGIRVDGLTLLPPGRLFLMLCRLSFGLVAKSDDKNDLVQKCVDWVASTDLKTEDNKGYSGTHNGRASRREEWERRAHLALELHEMSWEMGETLQCCHDKVAKLHKIFDGLANSATKFGG